MEKVCLELKFYPTASVVVLTPQLVLAPVLALLLPVVMKVESRRCPLLLWGTEVVKVLVSEGPGPRWLGLVVVVAVIALMEVRGPAQSA